VTPRILLRFLLAAVALAAAGERTAVAGTIVTLGTVAPEGSLWHEVLLEMGQAWAATTGGEVRLHIYAGGTLGGEVDMLKKMRIGQLHAVAMSGVGLSHVEPGVGALQLPLMFDSYEELDHVRDGLAPRLEASLRQKGFLVLNWGDAGWVHFFTKTPAATPDDIRRLKLFISAGDAEALDLYKAAGMRPVPLAETDILTALQTGMIEAFDVPPLLALINQWFGLANHMLDLRWAPLIGATLIDRKVWERVPERWRGPMLASAHKAGERLRGDIRRMGDEAVVAMQKRGLEVIRVDDATRALWRREVEAVYPKLRGPIVPADLFDEVRRLRDEYRARAGKRGAS
jgi:TRAP-type C4-dicarboxylate transport system substrate-binding protein